MEYRRGTHPQRNRSGLPVILVSNQSGVAREFFIEEVVEAVHRNIASLLESGGAHIDAYYYCPHHPNGSVRGYKQHWDCRKPGRGLVDRTAHEFGIYPARSFVVGDRWLDVALARTVGAQGVLVRTGYGLTEEPRLHPDLTAAAIVDNLVAAAGWILRTMRG